MEAVSPLDGVLKRAGAHMARRDGWIVAADFGSLAAELAVTRAAAGLADVSNTLGARSAELGLNATYAGICVVGPAAEDVLSRAGIGSPREGGRRTDAVGGIPVLVVREGRHRWLLVVPAADAAELWRALSDAGGPVGLAYVGADALHHLEAAGDR